MRGRQRREARRFGRRLLLVVAVAALAAGFIQYEFSIHFAERRALDAARADHADDGRLMTALGALPGGSENVQALISSFSARRGVEHASVVASDGEVLADLHEEHRGDVVVVGLGPLHRAIATGAVGVVPEQPGVLVGPGDGHPTEGGHEEHDADHEAEGRDGEHETHGEHEGEEEHETHGEHEGEEDDETAARGEPDDQSHQAHQVFVTPVEVAGRPAGLVVVQQSRIVGDDVASSRVLALASAAVAVAVALLVFALVGARRLTRQHEEALEHAHFDRLTELGNRLACEQEVRGVAASVASTGGQFAFALLDLDHFKEVNDSLGHVRGDEVLVSVARCIAAFEDTRAFRLGGDEFALLLPDRTAAEAIAVLEALRREVEALDLGVTVSAGVTDNTDGSRLTDLMSRADLALYSSKHGGRNRTSALSADAMPEIVTEASIAALDKLIRGGCVRTVFQPIVASPTRAVVGYEALTRPVGVDEFATPDRLFAVADALRRVGELDRLCIARALDAAGSLPADATVFVNVHPRSLVRGDVDAAYLAQVAARHGIGHDRVVVEVTERAHTDTATLAEACLRMTEAGFGIALDDVGTGHNGLELLRTVRFSYLKVDRSVILGSLSDQRAAAVLSGLSVVAAHSGATLVAEGIEDEAMAAAVTECRSDGRPRLLLQGYLFGRPEAVVAQDAVAHSAGG